jgi:hypothetical protein
VVTILLSEILFIVMVTLTFDPTIPKYVYWILTKLGHMIPLWKGKNPIYFGVITIIPFDNLYRQAYFVMHTFLVVSIVSSWEGQVSKLNVVCLSSNINIVHMYVMLIIKDTSVTVR